MDVSIMPGGDRNKYSHGRSGNDKNNVLVQPKAMVKPMSVTVTIPLICAVVDCIDHESNDKYDAND